MYFNKKRNENHGCAVYETDDLEHAREIDGYIDGRGVSHTKINPEYQLEDGQSKSRKR